MITAELFKQAVAKPNTQSGTSHVDSSNLKLLCWSCKYTQRLNYYKVFLSNDKYMNLKIIALVFLLWTNLHLETA